MTFTNHPAFAAADRLAPIPPEAGNTTLNQWAVYYAALSFAAFTAFHDERRNLSPNPEPGSRPELGQLMEIAVSALHSAILTDYATVRTDVNVADLLWSLTPGYGAMNGEFEEWLVDALDAHGVNPADINPAYVAADFRSPSRPAPVFTSMNGGDQ